MSVKIKSKVGTVVGLFVHKNPQNGASRFEAKNDGILVDEMNTAICAGDGMVIVSPDGTQCIWVAERPTQTAEEDINIRLTLMTNNVIYGHGLLLGFDQENKTVTSLSEKTYDWLHGH